MDPGRHGAQLGHRLDQTGQQPWIGGSGDVEEGADSGDSRSRRIGADGNR
jgi:hypothetical protein